jgi:biopolymer transport protein ExbD
VGTVTAVIFRSAFGVLKWGQGLGATMLRKLRKTPKLFSDFNTLQFASVMAMVVFVVLLAFMAQTTGYHGGIRVDLPNVSHPVSMPGALREDVMQVVLTRDGKVYFGREQIGPYSLSEKIQIRLKDRGVERKIYIKADRRAHWGSVEVVLDGVRSAGILRVAFLAF